MQILKFDSVIQTANAITNCKMKQAKTALTMNYCGVHRTLALIAVLCFANIVLADLANFGKQIKTIENAWKCQI